MAPAKYPIKLKPTSLLVSHISRGNGQKQTTEMLTSSCHLHVFFSQKQASPFFILSRNKPFLFIPNPKAISAH